MTTPLNEIPEAKILDVCDVPCSEKHQLIFGRYDALAKGDFFVLHNGHDPIPLRGKFEALFPGGATWDYLQEGPEVWQVKISKVRSQQSSGEDVPSACGCSH